MRESVCVGGQPIKNKERKKERKNLWLLNAQELKDGTINMPRTILSIFDHVYV